eukprot:UN05366
MYDCYVLIRTKYSLCCFVIFNINENILYNCIIHRISDSIYCV